jgi:hypothetical protein
MATDPFARRALGREDAADGLRCEVRWAVGIVRDLELSCGEHRCCRASGHTGICRCLCRSMPPGSKGKLRSLLGGRARA